MAFYGEKVAPRLIDWACGARSFAPWRQKVCEGLYGKVVEIGFGSGHNVPYYPSKIEVVYAIEPISLALKLASKRIDSAFVSVDHVGSDGQDLPLADESCDGALSSFTLCTVPDPSQALKELWRVLKPGGQFHFLEHGLAPTTLLNLTQRAINPLEVRLGGGCHLNRRPLDLIRSAGFELLWSDEGPAKGPKPWCYCSAGVAIKV
jgi:SAM-dependent methyltransferase